GLLVIANAAEQKEYFPALDPPFLRDTYTETTPSYRPDLKDKEVTTEWKYHKTADGSHPNGHEQQVVWLMNRARSNPTREGVWLAGSTDPNVARGRDYFGVDKNILKNEFAALAVKPPAAFDNRLYAAAYAHSLDLIARDAQDHTHQFDRIRDAGFHFRSGRGSVFSYADSGINAHAAWNIDWGGNDEDGMQNPRGHRMATMSADGNYTNVGIAAPRETNPGTSVGEYVTTGNYCLADTYYSDHYNQFIVGTVWTDRNGNNQYDPGEGEGNVTAKPDRGAFYAITGNSGGYAFPVGDGNHSVTFSGGGLPCNYAKSIVVGGKSVLIDIEIKSDFATYNCDNNPSTVPLPAILHLLRDRP
ncbi:MAG: hypothetical protein JRC69_02970, partial [Deltaproteobacteria bacterium]|nr:hypothetical protein [Deltaproteobacteria bacterium]